MRILLLLAAVCAAAQTPPPRTLELQSSSGVIRLTAIRHASFLLEAAGKVLCVDPAQGDFASLPKADFILYTHIHGDHFVPAILEQVRKPDTQILAPRVVADKIPGAQVMANGEKREFGPWSVEALPMYNMKRGPSPGTFYHDKGQGNGYVVSLGGRRIYIAGDTEGIPEMRALKNIDLALIPMNLPYTMPPEEAADAVRAFHPRVAVPYHYRGSDLAVFEKALAGSGIEVKLLAWY
jgi:L-ascorbate metabolism protein UlaG (beta-lactamase superfamily)